MGASCELFPHCINPKGEVVESKLFKDLLHYTSDRGIAKEFYAVGTNKDFIEQVEDNAEFDDNGEMTFQSLKNLSNLNIEKEKEIAILNKELGVGEYSYEEGMAKLQNFNKNSPYNDKYLGTISSLDNGKFRISLAEKNEGTQEQLNTFVGNRNLIERIKVALNKAGADYTFLEEGSNLDGRYNTKNAVRTADGLYQLIKVANNEKLEQSLAEEAGHFAVGALGKSPLVKRLMELLTPDVQKQILGDEYLTKSLGSNSAREVAGTLVGQAIMQNVDKNTPWYSLTNRIVDLIKKVFNSITGNEIAQAKLEAQEIAEQIAKGFMSPNFTGNIKNALDIKETLYSKTDSFAVQKLKEAAILLRKQALEMKAINSTLFSKYNAVAKVVESKIISNADNYPLAEHHAYEGITESVLLMSKLMEEDIKELLDSVDINDVNDFNQNMVRNAQSLRKVRTFVRNAGVLIKIISDASLPGSSNQQFSERAKAVEIINSAGDIVIYNLYAETQKLKNSLENATIGEHGIVNELTNKEAQFFLKFLENALGKKYIHRSAKILFRSRKKNKAKGESALVYAPTENYTVQQAMEGLEEDISLFERFLASMSNNSDLVAQIIDKTIKLSNKWADDLTNTSQDKLRQMQADLKKLGHTSTDVFIEKSNKTGKITGNIISEYNWGDYEDSYDAFKESAVKEFKDAHPNLSELSDLAQGLEFEKFFKPKERFWHKGDASKPGNSKWDDNSRMWVPAEQYRNSVYDSTIKGKPIEKWLNELLEFKDYLDSLLPENSTRLHRMPQFKGTFINRVKNKQIFENTTRSVMDTSFKKIKETFIVDSEDRDFGSLQTYNMKEDSVFSDALAFEREKLNRLPLFGINKLQDPSELSTDLFHSLFAYSGMAHSYAALSKVVDTVEVGAEVLLERKVGGTTKERDNNRADRSRAYNRYTKYIEKQVYGIAIKTSPLGRRFGKLASFFSGLGSKIYLGGNVIGGMVNIGTGSIELFKEAFAGEHFSMSDWKNAHGLYSKNLAENMWDGLTGVELSDNKVALFIRHFNVLGKSKQEQRTWFTSQWRLTRALPFGENIFLPYKAGEHYMQTIPYLALASKTKLYDQDGNKISLFNAYKVVDTGNGVKVLTLTSNIEQYNLLNGIKNKIDDAILKNIKPADVKFTTEELKFINKNKYSTDNLITLGSNIDENILDNTLFFKSAKGKKRYDLLKSILTKLKSVSNISGPMQGTLQFTQEEQAYLDSKKYNVASTSNTAAEILEEMKNAVWFIDDDSSFMNKAREISNRMHGVYNNIDKVGLQQSIAGNMMLAMKGYALGLMERRFGRNKYSVLLEKDVEGSLVTLAKVFSSMFVEKGGFKNTAKMLLPIGESVSTKMLQAGYSPNQYRNMRRNLGDYLFILGLFLLKLALTQSNNGGDEDDEEDIVAGLGFYFTSRLLREQNAYALPNPFIEEAQSLLNVVPVGISVIQTLTDVTTSIIGGTLTDPITNGKYHYGRTKEGIYEENDPMWHNKVLKLTPYIRAGYTFEHPYEAAASFEYGKRLRTK